MATIREFSPMRITIFIICILLIGGRYTRKHLWGVGVRDWPWTKLLRNMLVFIILFSITYTFTTTKDDNFKILLLVVLSILVTLYNIHYSLKKCTQISTQYKITLYSRTIIIIVIFSWILVYANKNGLVAFLYRDGEGTYKMKGTSIDTIDDVKFDSRDAMPGYCPDMKGTNYSDRSTEEGELWAGLSSEQKNNCLAGVSGVGTGEDGERDDISKGIYA